MAAAAIAREFRSPLFLITNVPGILKNGKVLPEVTPDEIQQLIHNGTITGGMIPKVNAALECLSEGIDQVVILNGAEEDILERFMNRERIGTTIQRTVAYQR